MTGTTISRRQFGRLSTAAAGACAAAPWVALPVAQGATNGKVGVAFVGAGGRGPSLIGKCAPDN